jgi:predicted RNA-binding protein with PIN domain
MIVIDGHNLLWAIEESHPESGPISDIGMCRIIGRYLKQAGEKGEVVFDGTGPPDKSGFDNIEGVEVFFAGSECDADAVIEDKIKANTSPRRLSIVSSDRRLRRAARARRASTIKSEVFWGDLQRQLGRRTVRNEPPAKQDGLSETETDQWLRQFGLDR